MKARLNARLTQLERRLKPERWVTVIDNDELEAAGYYLVRTDEALTGDERYYCAVLAIAGGTDPLPPGLIKVRRDELEAVMARMNAQPFIVRAYDTYPAETGKPLRELEIEAHGEERVREMEEAARRQWRETCERLWEARRERANAVNVT